MVDIQELHKEIETIKKRNGIVDQNKAWEGSYTRRALLIAFTYFAIASYLTVIGVDRPLINAIVPAIL